MDSRRRLGTRLLWGASFVLAALAVYPFLFPTSTSLDTRPLGTPEDIDRLAEREDLNVLFVLIDTLRAHRLRAYGYHRETSPTLDHLAFNGVRFARHLAQSSWTKASMASLWTGLYPTRTGVTRFPHALPDEATLPAEILEDAGFHTAGIWRNGWIAPTFGFDQGFDSYHRPVARPTPASVRREKPNMSLEGTDHDVIDAAVEYLRVHGHKRWFLYLHLMDVHQYLYDEDSALFGSAYSDIYDNSIHHEDGVMLRLLATLSQAGLLDRTLIVITSDHGEAFRERGLEGHARHVYRESTEVPFIVSFPFRLGPGVVVYQPTRNIDVWPTLLDMLGLPELPEADGRSFLPEIRAAAVGARDPAAEAEIGIAHLDRSWGRGEVPPRPAVAVTDGDFRYVTSFDPATDFRSEELFSHRDPGELENRIRQEPETAERLRAVAAEYLERTPAWESGVKSVEVDHLERNQLRALGYSIP